MHWQTPAVPGLNGSHPLPRDLAIDLGTANTLVYERGVGIVLNEPSVIALDARAGTVLAVGNTAWQMIGRTPSHIVALRPLSGGAITDFENTQHMIRLILQQVGVGRFVKTRVVACVPPVITPVERRALTEAIRQVGVSDVRLIEQTMAAAIGSGQPVNEPRGTMVIDVGGGTSQSAVLSLGGIVSSNSVRSGSFDMDQALRDFIRNHHGMVIGDRTSEQLKILIGSALPGYVEADAEVKGREISTGLPRKFTVTHEEAHAALAGVLDAITQSIIDCLSATPTELAQDLLRHGARLLGGGSLLQGFDALISQKLAISVYRTESPLETVVNGAGRALESWSLL